LHSEIKKSNLRNIPSSKILYFWSYSRRYICR